MTAQNKNRGDSSKDVPHGLFFNERGETFNSKVELFTDPDRGETWRAWATKYLPINVFRAFGMVDAPEGEEWLNVVEHSVFVAAASLVVGARLAESGISVDFNKLVRSAIVHDVSKRFDLERKISRDEEAIDKTFETVIAPFGYTADEIDIAKNTGRQTDRYIQDPVERLRAIASYSIEANILSYVDARTRGSHIFSITDAMNDSIAVKPKDEEFFTQAWRPYFDAVEGYLKVLSPQFDPSQVSDDSVFEAARNAIVNN